MHHAAFAHASVEITVGCRGTDLAVRHEGVHVAHGEHGSGLEHGQVQRVPRTDLSGVQVAAVLAGIERGEGLARGGHADRPDVRGHREAQVLGESCEAAPQRHDAGLRLGHAVAEDAERGLDANVALAAHPDDGARFAPLEGENHILLEGEPAWKSFVTEVHSFLEKGNPAGWSANVNTSLTLRDLTTREYEVLELVAAGLSNTQIAERLCLEPKTVRNHITHIYAKMGVNNRAQALIFAREAGLGSHIAVQSIEKGFTRVSTKY